MEIQKVKKITEEAIKDYLFYCKNDRKYAFSTMKQVIAAISFLYTKVFFKPIPKALDIKLRKPTHLPIVLSNREIAKIIETANNLKHKTILMLIYSGGLRLGELLNLKISDVDSESMKIHIRQGKGKNDRYIMLSENVLQLLREYYKIYKPKEFIIEGQKGGNIVPKVFNQFLKVQLKKEG